MNKNPFCILFDWDNTLVDTWGVLYKSINKVLKNYGMAPYTMNHLKKTAYKSMRESFPGIFGKHWQEAGDLFYQHIQDLGMESLKPLPNSFNLINFIHDLKIPMGIISNKSGILLRKEVAHLGWNSFFEHIIGSGDTSRDKPNPQPILHVLAKMNIKPSLSVWYVGDMPGDWNCAKLAKCQPIAIHQNPQDENIPFFKNCLGFKEQLLEII